MNLLIVCHHDPQRNKIGAVRIRKFAENLAAEGCSVKVLSRSGVTSYLPDALAGKQVVFRSQTENSDVPIARPAQAVRSNTPDPTWAVRFRHKLRSKFAWVFRHLIAVPDREVFALKAMLEHSQELGEWSPEVVVASGPPFSTLLVAKRLSRRHGVPWVADYRDLWTLSSYYSFGPIRRRVDRVIESYILRSVALVTTVSKPLADEMQEAFRVRSEVVLNGYDPNDLATLPPVKNRRMQLPLHIVYTGQIYQGKRDPEPLFQALASMNLSPNEVLVEFHGENVRTVEAIARRHGVEHLISCGSSLSHLESLALQQQADVLLLLMWNNPGEKGVFTGKLFEYLGVRRPILMLGYQGGVAAELIRSRGAGVIANEQSDIVSAVTRWLEQKRDIGRVAELPADIARGLTRQEQSKRLLQLCQSILESRTNGIETSGLT